MSRPSSARRRVRVLSGVIAAGALIVGFGMTASSASAASGPVNTTPPVITGEAIVGNTIHASDGIWTTDAGPLTYTYLWSDDNSGDRGEGADYEIQSNDIGQTLTVTVTATDTNGYDDEASTTMSSAVVASDIVNTSPPTITGHTTLGSTLTVHPGTWTAPDGETIVITYSWGSSSGQSGGALEPPVVTSTHKLNKADFGMYMAVVVTATAGGQQTSVSAFTEGRVKPNAPFATDAGFTSSNQGTVTQTQTATKATITVPSGHSGDLVYVYGYSTPKSLGFFTLSGSKKISVPLTSLADGDHTLAVMNSSGALVGWVSVAAGSALAATGSDLNLPIGLGGAGALLVVGGLLWVARRKHSIV